MKEIVELSQGWKLYDKECNEKFEIPYMPMQVHEILYYHKKISDGFHWGKTEDCQWVNDKTWVYETKFDYKEGKVLLSLPGLDTLCTIWINGMKIGEHRDSYLPFQALIEGFLKQGENSLCVIFEPVKKELERISQEYKELLNITTLKPANFIRKTFHDFTNYLGNDEDFYKTGIYAPVQILCYPEQVGIHDVQVRYSLNERLDQAKVYIMPEVFGIDLRSNVEVTVKIQFCGKTLWEKTGNVDDDFTASLEDIQLWWPRGYGEQTLYEIHVQVIKEGTEIDERVVFVGFRKVEMKGMLDFAINQVPMKLWGANLTPDGGHTLCENQERLERLLKLAEEANVNTLRLWGEGTPFGDFLYEYADRHGLLLWQEFFCGHAQYPNCENVRELILKEAEYLIKSKRHHPSVILWCGGNECYLSRDFIDRNQEYLAADFFEYDLKELCSRLDPERYYHINSPFFGRYSNDPLAGDTHSYTNSWYVPGSDYPIFASENLRISFPKEESLKRYLRTETLPVPRPQKHGELPWPVEYERITSAESYKKIPPVEQFYVPETPEEMIYSFGMAAGSYIKDSVERYRRGKKPEETFQQRLCKGHFIWKWNTTFPHIYSSMIDAYLEQKIPYYFLKRAYEPLKVSIETGDHIYIWVVNDTRDLVKGTVIAKIFDVGANQFTDSFAFPVSVQPGESVALGTLDMLGQMTRDKIIYAELVDEKDEIVARSHQYLDIERHIIFPDVWLKMWQENNELCICSDQFARCVELKGLEDKDSYWWDFSDNYFDLFPGEVKKIQITGKHEKGNIRAKSFYSSKDIECIYRKQ